MALHPMEYKDGYISDNGYDAAARFSTRTWARNDSNGQPIVTNYTYDPISSDLSGISYSDDTPAVTFAYDRIGRKSAITDVAGTHALTYAAGGQQQEDRIVGGLLGGVTVTVGYDSFLRRESLQATRNSTTLVNQGYSYDTSGRLQTVTNGGQTVDYAFYPTSGLLNTTTFTGNTQIARSYDELGHLQNISTTAPSGTVASYNYTYNDLDQRSRLTCEDNSYWAYGYNDHGELTSGKKYWSDGTPVWGSQNEYGFDNIGNRTATLAGGDASGANMRSSTYIANELNQYSQRTVPGVVDVLGSADSMATVTVNQQSAYRKGAYFAQTLTLDNSSNAVYAQVNVTGVKSGAGAGGQDIVTNQNGYMYLPKSVEAYSYDLDGNLSSDGRWNYTWDAENRPTSMTALSNVSTGAKKKLEFTYDWMGRRIQKKGYGWNAQLGAYQLQSTTKFVYDGWNIVAELDGSNDLNRSYAWGAGELLSIAEGGNSYYAGYSTGSRSKSVRSLYLRIYCRT